MAAPANPQREELLKEYSKLTGEYKAHIQRKTTLDAQLQECTMVRDEVEALKEDDPVYKMHGKVLILQDMSEARSTVAARLRLIQGELTKVEKAITGVEGTRTAVINKLQGGGQAQQEDS